MLIAAERVLLTAHPDFVAGWVEVDDDTIAAVGEGAPPRPADLTVSGSLVPGFVDVHCHGGGGAAFATDDPADVDTAILAHWLAPGFKGAHSPELLSDPVPDVVAELLASAGGNLGRPCRGGTRPTPSD